MERRGANPAGTKRRKTLSGHSAKFLGKPVCKFALRHLYGVGATTINKIYKGELALHEGLGRKCPKHPQLGYALRESSRVKWTHILMYFWMFYHNVAEVLPSRLEMPAFSKAGTDFFNDDADLGHENALRHLQGFLRGLDAAIYNPDANNIGPGTIKGPRRFVQTTTATSLYQDYCGYERAAGREASCLNTFLRCFHKVFETHLGFRSKGLHTYCDFCSRMKVETKKAKTKERRQEVQRLYSNHLVQQWLDRQFYWSMRALSAESFRTSQRLGAM